jgi:hypothetical protein
MRNIGYVLLFILTACGFKPLYGDSSDITDLEGVKINVASVTADVPQRFLHTFKYALEDEFNPDQSESRYTKVLNVDIVKTNVSYETQNNTSNRTRITMSINFALMDINTDKILLKDKMIAIDSFQVADSPYSALITDEETSIRMINEAVKEIKLRVLRNLGA